MMAERVQRAAPGSSGWFAAVVVLFGAVAAVYIYLATWRYAIFRAGVDDCIFTQVVNGAFGGFSSTVEGSVNHFLVHFSPILYLALPFVRLFDGARGLIILQCLLAAATLFPVWGLAVSRFPKWQAFLTVLAAAAYPPLAALAVGDFHELAFVPPLAAALVWALDRRRWQTAVAMAVLLALVKEDQFVSLAVIGCAVAFFAKRDRGMRACGLWIASIGVAGAVFYFGLLRPLLDPKAQYFSFHFYQWWKFPPTPAGFAGPFSPLRAQYLLAVLLPLAFLPLASRFMLFALPGLAEVLLSHEAITMSLGAHYTATWIGYVLCAFVDGTAAATRWRPLAGRLLLIVALAASLLISRFYSPIDPGFALYRKPGASDGERERYLAELPRTARVGTGGFIIAHLGMNPHATVAMFDGAPYLVFDAFNDPAYFRSVDRANVARLIAGGGYRLIYDHAGIVVLYK